MKLSLKKKFETLFFRISIGKKVPKSPKKVPKNPLAFSKKKAKIGKHNLDKHILVNGVFGGGDSVSWEGVRVKETINELG